VGVTWNSNPSKSSQSQILGNAAHILIPSFSAQVKPGGRPKKEDLVQKVSEALDTYESVYVFKFDNLRASAIKDLRMLHKDDRYFLGKNSVMSIALGRSPEEEPRDNLHQLSKHLTGNSGLFFTSRPRKEVVE
jgi:mRNA turnover protein 4